MAELRGGMAEAPDNGDLQEEEVWAMMKAREGSSSNSNSNSKTRKSSSSSSAWRFAATSRAIPRATSSGGGSVPLTIPDWSKILKKRPKKNLWDDDACDDTHDDDKFDHANTVDDDGDDDMVPPHEYIARRLARTQIASFSMCEGIGRTLKGRDLSNLRNAILTKTGFLE